MVVNSGQHCVCDYCQVIVKIVPELARKKKREENLQTALICLRPTQLPDLMPLIRLDIKKYFTKQSFSGFNRIWGIEFQLLTKNIQKEIQ